MRRLNERLAGRTIAVIVAWAVCGATMPLAAQPQSRIERVAPHTGPSTIVGTVRDAGDHPFPDGRLQLRQLQTGGIVQTTTSNANGVFSYPSIEAGTYVVELTAADGRVLATSEALTLASGDTVQTVVRLASRTRSFAWWFGATTATALAQAASLGVLAVDRGQPVSPQ
jgi:hypothetical protein